MLTDRPATEPRRPRRGGLRIVLALLGVAALAVAILAAPRSSEPEREAAARVQPAGKPTTGSADQVDPTAPLPAARPRVVEPVAGETSGDDAADARRAAAAAGAGSSSDDDLSLPKPTGPATKTARTAGRGSDVSDLAANKATALPNGVALPPLEAPESVLEVIRAGNTIARSPYKWGGGHGRFKDNGYDCSGSVSYALYAAGLINGSYTSGQLTHYGKPGKGRWITLYANGGHVFMEVAGIRFDTSGASRTGSRWQNEFRPTGGYVARHPPGL